MDLGKRDILNAYASAAKLLPTTMERIARPLTTAPYALLPVGRPGRGKPEVWTASDHATTIIALGSAAHPIDSARTVLAVEPLVALRDERSTKRTKRGWRHSEVTIDVLDLTGYPHGRETVR